MFGFVWGLLLMNDSEVVLNDQALQNPKMLVSFLNYFTMNFWYLFLMWLFSLHAFTMVFTLMILMVKGMVLGVFFKVFVNSFSLIGMGKFLIENIFTFLIIIPLMYYTILSKHIDEKRRLIVIFFGTVLYSLSETFI